jgi:hypothetical protein
MTDINTAVADMFTTSSVMFIKHASKQEKIFLVSLLRVLRSNGVAEAEMKDVKSCALQ